MAIETYFLPGYGIVVDEEDGDEYFLSGYGVVANEEVPSQFARPASDVSADGNVDTERWAV